ncbi:hypothetical protein Acr_00g0072820 [Actinidia rufa]|uniref:Uncharacterized protein n=1 Tax=Actinidia rufa TaxID=165716 RepID=A0A7J0DT94_9ERIC|nr:hypothetical protein Acr_00g0072820 [Actinidia rufa]
MTIKVMDKASTLGELKTTNEVRTLEDVEILLGNPNLMSRPHHMARNVFGKKVKQRAWAKSLHHGHNHDLITRVGGVLLSNPAAHEVGDEKPAQTPSWVGNLNLEETRVRITLLVNRGSVCLIKASTFIRALDPRGDLPLLLTFLPSTSGVSLNDRDSIEEEELLALRGRGLGLGVRRRRARPVLW